MKHSVHTIAFFALFSTCLFAQGSTTTSAEDELAIKEVLVKCYVEGIHINRDSAAVKGGFHPSFLMHVYAGGQIIKASLDMWLERLKLDGIKNTNRIEAEFKSIDKSGNTAVVRMEIYENSNHIYTDYFGLYKFADGWKIVNKIFYTHE